MIFEFEVMDPSSLQATPEFGVVESFLRSTSRRQIGWHYIMDLTWICIELRDLPAGSTVLDVGGGLGPAQFLLAELGYVVTNLDLILPEPRLAYRSRYGTSLERLASHRETDYVAHMRLLHHGRLSKRIKQGLLGSWPVGSLQSAIYASKHDRWAARHLGSKRPASAGTLRWKTGNVCEMPECADASFDAVISVSAIEHIPWDALPDAWDEIRRVVKSDGLVALTTSASAGDASWFHEPSQGWCFGQTDMQDRLGARFAGQISIAEGLRKYRECDYLREHLASFYARSGDNGMPWGRWDPTYVPIGLRRAA